MPLTIQQAVMILSLYEKCRICTRNLDLQVPTPDYHNAVSKDNSKK